jgi:hypothetical protein
VLKLKAANARIEKNRIVRVFVSIGHEAPLVDAVFSGRRFQYRYGRDRCSPDRHAAALARSRSIAIQNVKSRGCREDELKRSSKTKSPLTQRAVVKFC